VSGRRSGPATNRLLGRTHVPAWLDKTSAGSKRRGLDALTREDIDAEIASHRREQGHVTPPARLV
jgi:hypothetical protein